MTLFLGLIFSSVGGVMMFYGKRQHDVMFLVTGFVLAIYPYFVSNALLILLIGIALCALPIARHKGWL